MNQEFRRFTVKSFAPKSNKGITMPSQADYGRMHARRRIEDLEDQRRLREEYEL